MTDPDNISIFNMPPPQIASSNSNINKVNPQFQMNSESFEPCSSLDHSHSFKRPEISHNKHSNALMGPPPRMNHPPSNGGMSHILFKTRLCANLIMSGSCRWGKGCTFAHGVGELREPQPNRKELAVHRTKEQLQLGGNWNDHSFHHEGSAKFRNDSWKTRKSSAIIIRTIGNNLEGNKTVTKPPRSTYWKTKMCSTWEHTRSCPFGDDCNFAHGDAELRVSGGGIEAEAAVIIPNSTKAVIPTLPAKEDKKHLLWLKLNKINRIYGDWIDD